MVLSRSIPTSSATYKVDYRVKWGESPYDCLDSSYGDKFKRWAGLRLLKKKFELTALSEKNIILNIEELSELVSMKTGENHRNLELDFPDGNNPFEDGLTTTLIVEHLAHIEHQECFWLKREPAAIISLHNPRYHKQNIITAKMLDIDYFLLKDVPSYGALDLYIAVFAKKGIFKV